LKLDLLFPGVANFNSGGSSQSSTTPGDIEEFRIDSLDAVSLSFTLHSSLGIECRKSRCSLILSVQPWSSPLGIHGLTSPTGLPPACVSTTHGQRPLRCLTQPDSTPACISTTHGQHPLRCLTQPDSTPACISTTTAAPYTVSCPTGLNSGATRKEVAKSIRVGNSTGSTEGCAQPLPHHKLYSFLFSLCLIFLCYHVSTAYNGHRIYPYFHHRLYQSRTWGHFHTCTNQPSGARSSRRHTDHPTAVVRNSEHGVRAASRAASTATSSTAPRAT